MRKKFRILVTGAVIIGAMIIVAGTTLISRAESESESARRKIVVFKSGVLNESAREALVKKFGGVKVKDLNLIDGKAVLLSPKAEAALAGQAGVLRIDDDVVVEALVRGGIQAKPAPTQPAEVLPWGIDKIDAELVWPGGNKADLVKVGIIDTGISNTHPDLSANVRGGVNTINPLKSWNDDNGHGSHVAGIIAALDNDIGVIGVGPKIDLYAIKVLNRNGSGWLSDVIEGIQWGVANGMQVLNMSLGTSENVQSMHVAVIAARNAGVVVVAAAGNNGGSVIFPAAYPEVIAVGATDENNALASFSSRGPEIDLTAPGVSILSTYKGTGYAKASGTSMAAPHVAGSAALVLKTSVGIYDTNPNGTWDPDEVQKKLRDRTVDLGITGFDNLYGWGLVNAFNAVQP